MVFRSVFAQSRIGWIENGPTQVGAMSPLLLSVFFACDEPEASSEDGLSVRVLYPLEADTIGEDVVLVGLVQGGGDELSVWWESTVDGTLDTGSTPDEDGVLYTASTLSQGEHELWLYAEDGEIQAFDSVAVSIGAGSTGDDTDTSAEPGLTVALLSPTDGSTYKDDESVTFQGLVSNTNGIDLSVSWRSSLDGTLQIDDAPDSDGRLEGTTSLSEGTHTITLSATSGDESHEDSIKIEMLGYNVPPEISISMPSSGSSFESDDQIYLKVSVSDKEDDPTELEVSWSSDLDGDLITEYGKEDGTVRCYSSLTAGEHTLTAVVTDSRGAQDSATTTVSVTDP